MMAFFALSMMALTTSEVKGFYGEYTIQPMEDGSGVAASRCDHLIQPPSYQDAWTATGIGAYYDEDPPPAYDGAIFHFERGYGGTIQNPHTWTIRSDPLDPLICQYQYGPYSFTYYDNRTPSWGSGEFGLYYAYYQDLPIDKDPFSPYPYRQTTVGANAQSYFIEVADPSNRIYISSPINPNDMYAPDPNWRDS
jgi:hypothetical protein